MYNPDSPVPYDARACKAILDEYEVSAHYLIDRNGTIWKLVPEERRAWHIGVSQMPEPDSRTGVNAFSIGVEVIGNETDGFTNAQYESLTALAGDIMRRLPIRFILGHKDIAPERKTDPWNFDWDRFKSDLAKVKDAERLQMISPQKKS